MDAAAEISRKLVCTRRDRFCPIRDIRPVLKPLSAVPATRGGVRHTVEADLLEGGRNVLRVLAEIDAQAERDGEWLALRNATPPKTAH